MFQFQVLSLVITEVMKFQLLSSLTDSVNDKVVGKSKKQSSFRGSFKNSLTRSSRDASSSGSGVVVDGEPMDVKSSTDHRPLRLGSFDFDGLNVAYPDLFHEASDMLDLSNLIYVLAEVRALARCDANAPFARVSDLPLPLDDVASILIAEADHLRTRLDDGAHAAAMGALGGLMRRREATRAALIASSSGTNGGVEVSTPGGGGIGGSAFGWMATFCGGMLGLTIGGGGDGDCDVDAGPSIITDVGDAKSDEELVYAVGVNPLEGRITIIFRGSVTKADFVADSRIGFVRAPNPNKFDGTPNDDDVDDDVNGESRGDDDGVGIHQGFYEYLFGAKGGTSSKYNEITSIVRRLLAEDPLRVKYKLYVTGHSLGGALATLFGYYASTSPNLPLPVTVVSVASPRVGNIEFARSFVELESRGRIRHLRIANHRDPVTLNPTMSARRALALSAKAVSPLGYLALLVTGNGEGGDEEMYFHTGIKLKLLRNACPESNSRCEITYSGASILAGARRPADTDMDAEDLADMEQAKKTKKKSSEFPMVSYHYGDAYSERMALLESDLKGLTLNGMYRSKARGMP